MNAAVVGSLIVSGCAAWTNPVAQGIPAHALPPELLAPSKTIKEPIPLTYLRQKRPATYRLGPDDVLGVYIEGVLGDVDLVPPVNVVEESGQAPSLGYPVAVREDGTVSLPQIDPVSVEGLTVEEATREIKKAYTTGDEPIIRAGRERIIVSLVRPRQVQVVVMRQDSPGGIVSLPRPGLIRSSREFRGGAERLIRGSSSGTGTIVNLPAYQNDVLNALARTGGLPGLDAENEIIIQRGYLQDELLSQTEACVAGCEPHFDGTHVILPEGPELATSGRRIVRIPLRLWPGEPLPFAPEDVVLHEGDVVVIESRDQDLYFSGGLLPSGQYPLPRDHDLTVIEAVSQIGGPLVNGGINSNNLSGALVAPGIGSPSQRLLTIVRRAPDGSQVTHIVNLDRALHDPQENLLVQAGDVLILQETKNQAITRFFTQFFDFRFTAELLPSLESRSAAAISVLPP